jgi:hypothetical protein
MSKFVNCLLLTLALLSVGSRVEAVPVLQLDIIGGHYDEATETIVSDGPSFTLVALLTLGSHQSFNPLDSYFVSAAITPQVGPTASTIGNYTWNGTNYRVTQDMTYGTPPLEGLHGDATRDPGDLSPHGTYPTFFNEFEFQFSAAQTATTYNSQDSPGGLTPSSTGLSYFQTFNVTTSLAGTYQLHFDLYDTYLRNCGRNGTCNPDEDIDHFAPFSHDAQSGPPVEEPPVRVPEPGTLSFLAIGLAMVARRLSQS